MSNVDNEIDKILKEVAESAWSLGLQTAPKDNLYNDRNNRMTPYKSKQAITTLLEQSERKARLEEAGISRNIVGDETNYRVKEDLDDRISALKGEQ